MSSRRLGQSKYIRLTHTSSEDVFRKSSRRLQDVFKTTLRRLQDVFKTSSRHLQDIFKTFSRHHQGVLQRCLQVVFKMYYHVKQFLVTIFKTSSRRIQNVPETYCLDGYLLEVCLGHISEKFMVSVQNFQE